jgi:hypothetical protein
MEGFPENPEAGSIDAGRIAGELYKEFESGVLGRLLEIPEETKRYLYFMAWLNTRLEEKRLGRIIVTGGFAVEVYTGRTYRTMDVDIIVEGPKAAEIIEAFLKKFSERIGRGYLPRYEALQLKSIDIVSTTYTRSIQPTKILIDNLHVYLEPVEELIITYLAGWKFWKSTEDRDKALWLLIAWRDSINMEYLEKRAQEEKVYDFMQSLEKLVLQAG